MRKHVQESERFYRFEPDDFMHVSVRDLRRGDKLIYSYGRGEYGGLFGAVEVVEVMKVPMIAGGNVTATCRLPQGVPAKSSDRLVVEIEWPGPQIIIMVRFECDDVAAILR